MADRRFFLCTGHAVTACSLDLYPNSHILGELRYVFLREGDEETRVTALALYETSLPACKPPATLPRIRLEIIGDARGIKCTLPGCANVQRWEIGKAAFLQLMSRFGKFAV